MLHPVLPPDPPPVTEIIQSANLISTTASDRQFPSALVVKNTAGSAALLGEPLSIGYPRQQVEVAAPQAINSGTEPTTEKLLIKEQLVQTIKNSQKRLIPSQTTTENVPLTPSETSPSPEIPQSTQTTTENIPLPPSETSPSPEISQSTQTTIENVPLTPSETSPSPEISQLSQQPSKVQFNTKAQANEAPKPSTIEFKSRTPISQSTTPNPTTQQQPVNIPNFPLNQPSQENQPPAQSPDSRRVIEVIADRQEYDEVRRVVTAQGNVVVRFDGAVVDADRLQVNLNNLIAVGEGNVALTRGDQVLRGQRFTYNFVQDSGELFAGSGEIFVPTVGQDFSFLPTDVTAGGVPAQPVSDRIRRNQPLTGVGSPGGININVGGGAGASNLPAPTQGGVVRRLRFEAARVDFYPRGWQARDVRITNDPFSPPELELRANKVTSTRETPLRDRIRTEGQRLVFDQGLTLPIPRDEQVIDRTEREVTPTIVSIGFDGDERGGVFVERGFQPINTEQVRWRLTPQFFVQKAVTGGTSNFPSLFGLRTRLDAVVNPRTVIEGSGELNSFDLNTVEDNLRASLRMRQLIGNTVNPHILTLEYSYRDRLYNGTLGFQTVQSSLGGVVISPVIPLGNTGLNLSYQGGAQYINANTDRQELLEPIRANDRISLGRLQGSVAVSGARTLWQGKALPATATEGLRYTPNPVVPYLQVYGGVTGTSSYYTNGDNQSTLTGTVGLQGQIGNFSRNFLDYTAFNLSYSQGLNSGQSPFLFDRAVDNRVLNAAITQQVYGPFRFGFQTSINLDTGQRSSTDYILEYSRRTYGITLRYNPVLELGGIYFRISDFNWTGGTNPFSEVQPVVDGVQQRDF